MAKNDWKWLEGLKTAENNLCNMKCQKQLEAMGGGEGGQRPGGGEGRGGVDNVEVLNCLWALSVESLVDYMALGDLTLMGLYKYHFSLLIECTL